MFDQDFKLNANELRFIIGGGCNGNSGNGRGRGTKSRGGGGTFSNGNGNGGGGTIGTFSNAGAGTRPGGG